MGQVQPDGVCRGALPQDDVHGEILHGGIEDLLHRAVDAVDLVEKQDVVFLQVREKRHEIPLLFDGRAGGDAHIDAHLVCDDGGQGRLPQARGPVQKHMIQGLITHFRGLDENG